MSTHVLHLTPAYLPNIGGIESHVATLCRALSNNTLYEPTVVTPTRNGGGGHTIEESFSVVRCRTLYQFRKSVFAPGVAYQSLTSNVDLVHVHAPFHFGLSFGTLSSIVRNLPLIITPHMYDTRNDWISKTYESTVYDFCLQNADAILPTTVSYIEGYEAFDGIRHKITTVPLSVDHKKFLPVESPQTKLGWKENETVLLFVGALEQHHFYKDMELLFDSFEEQSHFDRLILAGEGDQRSVFQDEVKRRGLEEKISFTGYVDEERLPVLYSAADAFILPSKADRGEAFGVVLLEAMACGTPVIAANIPGVRDVPGFGGTLYEPGDVESLIQAFGRILEGKYNPREMVIQNYTVERMLDQVTSVYGKVLAPA